MDIKTRIDKLSEQEAKAALGKAIHELWKQVECNNCPCEDVCWMAGYDRCSNHLFDWLIEEARK